MTVTLFVCNAFFHDSIQKFKVFLANQGAHNWSLILFWLDFTNGTVFERLVRESCDAVGQFRPAYPMSQDRHRIHARKAYGHMHPHLSHSSPTQVLHHELQLTSFKLLSTDILSLYKPTSLGSPLTLKRFVNHKSINGSFTLDG